MNLRRCSFHSILFWRACILLGLLLACSATSCQAADPGAKAAATGESPTATAKTPGTDSRKVVVTVNGEPIYEDELNTGLPQDAFKETLDAARDIRLERFTDMLVMQQFLKSQNIEVAQSEIDEDIASLKRNPPSAGCPCCRYESLDKYMQINYVTPVELVRQSRNRIGFQKCLEVQWQKAYPTPQARAELLKTKRSELEAKYAKAYHIFFNAAQDPDTKRDADAVLKKKRKLADEAWNRLQRGETFEAVAKVMSEDKMSAGEGGFLGHVSKGTFGKAFSDALFQMAPGTYSKPVASPWGYHIIRREPLTDEDILAILKEDYLGEKASETLNKINSEAKIERPAAAPLSAATGK